MMRFVVLLITAMAALVARADQPNGRGENHQNVALGKRYTLWPQPTYQLCTDPQDSTQLTDGRTTAEYFWAQKGTVGWQRVQYATVTVDLGKVEPIAGVAMTTAAGVAGVTWPMAIQILVSDDGKTFYDVGDLVALDRAKKGPFPEGYAIRRLFTDELSACGRFVQFVIIPLSGGPYLFTDEVEVFRGEGGLLQQKPNRGTATTARTLYEKGRIQRAVQHRWQTDAGDLETLITRTDLSESDHAQLAKRLANVRALGADVVDVNTTFRAVLPLGRHHAELFRLQAEFWKAAKREDLAAWVPGQWDPVELISLPPERSIGSVQVDTMNGEYRSAALNLANSTDKPVKVRLSFKGLPQAPRPGYVTLHDVQWTDTSQGVPIAAALPEADRTETGWTVKVLPGLVCQVWMTFHMVGQKAAEYSGEVLIESAGLKPQTVPIRLKVWPFEMPKTKTLCLGGWSYTDGRGSCGVTQENRPAFLAHLQDHCVNAPWATATVLRSFQFDKEDPTKIRLDTRRLDDWIEQWPDAKVYLVFLSVAHYSGSVQTSLGGSKLGSPDFNERVGTWISAWVRHLRTKGITPNRLGLLIHDEPHEGSDITALLAWAKAIQAAEPDVLIWEDPTYRNPAAAPAELFEVCDIICPNRPMWLDRGESFAKFYRDQQARGRVLQSYSCSGPGKLLDPYAYHRLQAWHCWDIGGTGSFFWAFGDNSGASSWNEYFAKAGPFTPLFLDDTSVTAGKHMEAIRESVQDYEYFVLLKKAVDHAKSTARTDTAVTRAERLLRNAAKDVLKAKDVDKLLWHAPKNRTAADQTRVQILEALTLLRR